VWSVAERDAPLVEGKAIVSFDLAIRVELTPEAPPDRDVVTALLRRLLEHGIAVERVAAVASSLEDRFLISTTRLEDRS